MSARLCGARLAALPRETRRPEYDTQAVRVGWAHLGCGAFHRAHQAEFADDLLAQGHLGWGLVGINLRAPDIGAALTPQDGLYLRVTRDGDHEEQRVIGAIREAVSADGDGAAAVRRLADPAIRVVTLTITEKGYCHVPSTGALQADHPDIVHDCNPAAAPRSTPGVLAAALAARRAAGAPPLTLVSCDNVPGNGAVLRGAVLDFARMCDPALAEWIEGCTAFPDTMVDRIVPATADADYAAVAESLGVDDRGLVVGESFRQWVIQDRFAGDRPPWEAAGAEIVPDTRPFEAMKMRLLNGCQSALAYLGYLADCSHTSDAMASPALSDYAARLMRQETAPTLAMPPGVDVPAYQASVLRRLRNAAIRHRTWQIATDGSQKIAQRLLDPLRWHLARGRTAPLLALAVAGWMQFVSGRDLRGRGIDVSDPLASRLRGLADQAGAEAASLVGALLSVEEVFGTDLRGGVAERAIVSALASLRAHGAERAAHLCNNDAITA